MQEEYLLKAIADMLDQKLASLNKRVDTVSEQINTLDERFNVLEEKVDVLDEKVTRDYDLVLEFYGRQQEVNCYLKGELKWLKYRMPRTRATQRTLRR